MDKHQIERRHLAANGPDALRPLIDFALPEGLNRPRQIFMAHWASTLEDSTWRAAERDFEAYGDSCPYRIECCLSERCAIVARRAWVSAQAGNAVAHMRDTGTL